MIDTRSRTQMRIDEARKKEQMKWDTRFIGMANHIALWSKDPSTKCGAVITDGNRIVSLGYNGFPAGVADDEDRYANRDIKYPSVLHAEDNAILFAQRDLKGCTLYVTPIAPCCRCAIKIIQVGISRVVYPAGRMQSVVASRDARWRFEHDLAAQYFDEAGVVVEAV